MIYKENLFQGKSFLVTGASSGLGAAVARKLSELGGEVTGVCRTKPPAGYVARWMECNLQEGIGALACTPGLEFDGVFHAAGCELVGPTAVHNERRMNAVMMAATAAQIILRETAQREGLVKDGGSVVMVSSVAAHRGAAYMTDYAASRAAIEGMCRAVAVELAPRNIRVNALTCGGFASPMHERLLRGMSAAGMQKYTDRHPLGIGHVDAVADAALFLLSDAARWVTGTAMVVDGGFLVA